MAIYKANIKNVVLEDLFHAVYEQDVLKLRSQLNVVQSSFGEEIRKKNRETKVREDTSN
jgi:hypothetical protein